MEKVIGLFDSIFCKLGYMERTQKVDISILKDFELAENQLSEFEKACIEAKERKVEDAFLFFHVMRSSRMILEKMRRRFSEAEARHENPVIVDLSKMVVPRLNELYVMVLPLFYNKQHVLSESERGAILRRLKIVRDVASSTSMIPSVEDEKKGIMKSTLKKGFNNLADRLQLCVDEE